MAPSYFLRDWSNSSMTVTSIVSMGNKEVIR
jgi:hypothetical protein